MGSLDSHGTILDVQAELGALLVHSRGDHDARAIFLYDLVPGSLSLVSAACDPVAAEAFLTCRKAFDQLAAQELRRLCFE